MNMKIRAPAIALSLVLLSTLVLLTALFANAYLPDAPIVDMRL